MVLDFFEVINCFEKKPEYDNEAYYIGDGEGDVHFFWFCFFVFI